MSSAAKGWQESSATSAPRRSWAVHEADRRPRRPARPRPRRRTGGRGAAPGGGVGALHRGRLRRRDRLELLRRGREDLLACGCCAPASRSTPAVAASAKPFDLDVGPGPDGAPVVVYSRAGDIFQYDPATGLEQPLAEVNTAGVERDPSIHRSALGFVREVRRKPVVYLRRDGNTRRQPRPRFKETLGVDGLELSARGLFVTYRTDIVPTCCTRATLYRVAGGKLHHVFYVGSGGANFGQIVTPTVSGRSIYFGAHEQGLRPGQPLLPLRPALAQAVRRARDEPRAVADLARRPLPDEPRDHDRRHRAPGHGPDPLHPRHAGGPAPHAPLSLR